MREKIDDSRQCNTSKSRSLIMQHGVWGKGVKGERKLSKLTSRKRVILLLF